MKRRHKRPDRVREPVQVYLDRRDRDLLENLAAKTSLSRAEVLRRALRRFAREELSERPPGWSFERLIGVLGEDPSLPADLAERHDTYFQEALERLRDQPADTD